MLEKYTRERILELRDYVEKRLLFKKLDEGVSKYTIERAFNESVLRYTKLLEWEENIRNCLENNNIKDIILALGFYNTRMHLIIKYNDRFKDLFNKFMAGNQEDIELNDIYYNIKQFDKYLDNLINNIENIIIKNKEEL